jgi:hypothetical protein
MKYFFIWKKDVILPPKIKKKEHVKVFKQVI